MPFLDSLDIANRALQKIGAERIETVDENSKNNKEVSFVYDTVRRAELRRNVWVFSIRWATLRAIGNSTRLLDPRSWNEEQLYLPGSLVKDDNGIIWMSVVPENEGNEPGATTAWDQYFGPMTAEEYDEDTTYSAGELVYVEGDDPGGFTVFMSLSNDNEVAPATGTAWVSTTLYGMNDVVLHSSSTWRSVIPVNRGITPATGPSDFDIDVSYSAAQTVTGSDGFIYSSVGNGNVGNDPVEDNGTYWTNTGVAHAWKSVPTMVEGASSWRPMFATLKSILFTYPIGTGPREQSSTSNIFRKPAGFLRLAVQNPKEGRPTTLGGPRDEGFTTLDQEGNYFVGYATASLTIRFAADVVVVPDMDDLFCEGFACRIAYETCEIITASGGKLQAIGASYNTFMGDARRVNSIEIGPIDPPEDDLITVRR